ncbi:O-antigen ligase family protein [Rubritalea marina]|uniref:O-antigen ligase family protein n=1 Tax=Rubritalea marina TaxID=361055 RepID=UPI0003787FB2|nr:O-antigen ligase family protein [Rubritalea marina]
MGRVEQIIWFIVLVLLASFGVTMSWTLAVCLMAGVALASIVTAIVNWRVGGRRWDRWDSLSLGALGYFGLRAYFSPVFDLGKEDMVFWVMGWLTLQSFRAARLSWAVVAAICLVVFINASYSLMQVYDLQTFVPMHWVSSHSEQSYDYGIFKDYGGLGNGMAMSAMVLAVFSVWGRSLPLWKRLLMGFLAVVAMLLCLSSGSRIGVVSCGASMVLFIVFSWMRTKSILGFKSRKWRLGIAGVSFILAIVASFTAFLTFENRDYQLAATGEISEHNIRQSYWGMASEQISEVSFFGSGSRSYSYLSWEHWKDLLRPREADPQFTHNEYFQVCTDYGLVGLLVLSAVVCTAICYGSRRFMRRQHESIWCPLAAGMLLIVVVCVHSLTDFAMRLPFNWCMANVGLAWCFVQIPEGAGGKFQSRALAVTLPLCLAIASLVIALPELRASIPIIQARQVSDHVLWEPEEPEKMLRVYEKSSSLAADYRKSSRIAQIHKQNYFNNGRREQDLRAWENAAVECIERHPHYPVGILEMANLYREKGQYDLADEYYHQAARFSTPLDFEGRFSLNWAQNDLFRADLAYNDQDFDLTDALLCRAHEKAESSMAHRNEALRLIRNIMLSRINLHMFTEQYATGKQVIDELQHVIPPYILRQREARTYALLGDFYLQLASQIWQSGEHDEARQYFQQALANYRLDSRLRGETRDEAREVKEALAEEMLK